ERLADPGRVPHAARAQARQHVLEQERDDSLVLDNQNRESVEILLRRWLGAGHSLDDSGISMRQRRPDGSKSTTAMPFSCWTTTRSINRGPTPRSRGERPVGPPVSIQTRKSVGPFTPRSPPHDPASRPPAVDSEPNFAAFPAISCSTMVMVRAMVGLSL